MKKTLDVSIILWALFLIASPAGALEYDVFVPVSVPNSTEVRRYASDGTLLDTWPLPSGPALFALATDGVDILALFTDRVDRYTQDGTFVENIVEPGDLDFGVQLQIDPTGNLYVASPNLDRIDIFDGDGNPLLKFDSLDSAWGANGDGMGNIYVSLRNELRRYDATGNLLQTVSGFRFPGDVVIDHDSQVLYHASQNGMLSTYDISSGDLAFQQTVTTGADILFQTKLGPTRDRLFSNGAVGAFEVALDGTVLNVFAPGEFTVGPVAIAVPEPGGVMLALGAMTFVCFRRR